MSVERDKDWGAWLFTFETRKDHVFGFRLEDCMFEDSELLVRRFNHIIEELIEGLKNDS